MRRWALLVALVAGCGGDLHLEGTSWQTQILAQQRVHFGTDGRYALEWLYRSPHEEPGSWVQASPGELGITPDGHDQQRVRWEGDQDFLSLWWTDTGNPVLWRYYRIPAGVRFRQAE